MLPYTACPDARGVASMQAKQKTTIPTHIDFLTITPSFEKQRHAYL
jgi:hypothetical protein